MIKHISKKVPLFFLSLMLLILSGCDSNRVIINNIDEREANEIVVLLASKGIESEKSLHAAATTGGDTTVRFNIAVKESDATAAMAFLNQNGLPRVQGTNLLSLFAKQGLMSSQQEETIRFQAGLSEQIANTIRRIDGVIDAQVQIAFPSSEVAIGPNAAAPQKITAAVYVKHQGVLDDPNSHLVTKIKRLVASSVSGLELNDVTVIADRARYMDITLNQIPEALTPGAEGSEYVSIWSIVMSKASAPKFRSLFFSLIFGCIILALLSAWMLWKTFPLLKNKGGLRGFLQPAPFQLDEMKSQENTSHEEG